MKNELLRILDRAYATERFTTAGLNEAVTPGHAIFVLIRCLEDKCPVRDAGAVALME